MPTVEERLASLETKVDAMSDVRNLITEFRGDVNGRFVDINGRFGDVNRQLTELREDMNRRFIEMRGDVKTLDQKGDRQFIWLVGTQLALLFAVVGALLGAYYR